MRLRTFLGLVVSNLIWSANPVMGKWILADFSAMHAAWLRYSSAFAALVLWGLFFRVRRHHFIPRAAQSSDWLALAWMGLMAFTASPLLMMAGLEMSRATDGAIIVAMEPMVTVLLAGMVLKERLHGYHWVASALAFSGFLALSGLSPVRLAETWGTLSWGNLLLLFSLVGEASYSVLGRKLVTRHPPMALFGPALLIGLLSLTGVVFFLEGPLIPAQFTARSLLGLLWMGPLATAGGYLFWMHALNEVQVASVALTLFIQPVMGSVLGYLLLGERLSWLQVMGGGMILVTVSGLAFVEYRISSRLRR